MPAPIISVENLGKRYRIHHEQQERYTTLRDTLARKAKRLFHPSTLIPHPSRDEDFWALKDVSFEVNQGEVVGIIGRNGAGKSTLLKILSRITEPTTGRVTLQGRVASLLEVGTGFHPELTGRENIYLNGAILGMGKAEIRSKFDEIVAFAEVEKFLDTPVKHYSSGMYVRLAFAVAAHLEPEILIVDEVLAVGDAAFQKKCLGRMSEVASHGRTVLVVSHNIALIKSLCDRCILLRAGELSQMGPTREVADNYFKETTTNISSYIDLSKRTRNDVNPRFEIHGLEWLSELPLRHGEPCTFALHYCCHSAVQDVSLGLGFESLDGTRLLTFETDYSNLSRFNLNAGDKGIVELHFPSLPLAPDIYDIALGARSGDSFGLCYLPSVVQTEVVAGPTTPTHIMVKSGGVRIPCTAALRRTKVK